MSCRASSNAAHSGVSASSTNAAAPIDLRSTIRDATWVSKPKPHAALPNAGHSVLAAFAPTKPPDNSSFAKTACVDAAAATTSAATTETTAAMQGGAAPTNASESASPRCRALCAAGGENDSLPPSSAAAAHRVHTLSCAAAESNAPTPWSKPTSFSKFNEPSVSCSPPSANPKSVTLGLSSGNNILRAVVLPGEVFWLEEGEAFWLETFVPACPGRGSDPPLIGTWSTGRAAAT
mmetsp:Transcript_11540/g.42757  ORF Transcript_11540/g.42757 Transcript_11540/m.42757 type:complete len:235 (+) Transcript_11540:943-1647(+)